MRVKEPMFLKRAAAGCLLTILAIIIAAVFLRDSVIPLNLLLYETLPYYDYNIKDTDEQTGEDIIAQAIDMPFQTM